MGRILSGGEQSILTSAAFTIHARLVVQGVPLDEVLLTNPLQQATVVQDISDYLQGGTFTLALGRGSQSLSPYLSTGLQIDGDPALVDDRAITWQVKCSPSSEPATGTWRTVFAGAIDSVDVSPQANQVTIRCRDRMSHLTGTQIENLTDNTANGGSATEWGFPVTGGLLQDMIRAILDTGWQYSYGNPYPDPFTIIGTPPTESATDYWQERTSLMEAIRALGVGKNGWDIRGRWDQLGLDSFGLCYYKPNRLGDPLITVIPLQLAAGGPWFRYLRITKLGSDVTRIRNVAEVTPADTARVPVVSENAASIARVGRRFEAVSEDAASHIDTPAEAGVLGGLIVEDLGQAKTAIELALPFNWAFEINDLFQVEGDGFSYDQDAAIYAATHIELTYANGKGSTTLAGRAAGGAADMRGWLDKDEQYTKRATYAATTDAVGPARERAVWLTHEP